MSIATTLLAGHLNKIDAGKTKPLSLPSRDNRRVDVVATKASFALMCVGVGLHHLMMNCLNPKTTQPQPDDDAVTQLQPMYPDCDTSQIEP